MNIFEKTLVHDQDLPWQALGGGVRRKVMTYNQDLMLVKVAFDKGGIGSIHHHKHLQMSYIAKGSFEVTMGNDQKILHEGDVYFAPSDLPHGVVCLEEGILIDVFNPMREDFL